MIDWLQDFEKKFGHYEEIQNLKQKKFHGNITINICEGDVMNYNLTIHRRAVNVDSQSTSTKGDER
jgi:hypothetical protein